MEGCAQRETQKSSKKPNLPLKTVRRFIKEAGSPRVSNKAVKLLANLMEDFAKLVTGQALLFMQHSRRTTLLEDDFKLSQTESEYSRLLGRIRCQNCVRRQNKNE